MLARYFSTEVRPAGDPWASSFRSALQVDDRYPTVPETIPALLSSTDHGKVPAVQKSTDVAQIVVVDDSSSIPRYKILFVVLPCRSLSLSPAAYRAPVGLAPPADPKRHYNLAGSLKAGCRHANIIRTSCRS
jgi:hypothetical protein